MRYWPFSVRSDFKTAPPAFAFENGCDADVEIRSGFVPDQIPSATFRNDFLQIAPNLFRFELKGKFCFIVEGGERIIYACRNDADMAQLLHFLMGSGLGALCYQRELLPLHASAVECNGGIFAFAGHSGVGKSTLVAALAQIHGYAFFSDDLLIIDPNLHAGQVRCFASQKDLKLWEDSFELTNAIRRASVPIPLKNGNEKRYADLFARSLNGTGMLRQICILETINPGLPVLSNGGREFDPFLCRLERQFGFNRLRACLGQIYQPLLMEHLVGHKTLAKWIGNLVNGVSVYRCFRPHDREGFAAQVKEISVRLLRSAGGPLQSELSERARHIR